MYRTRRWPVAKIGNYNRLATLNYALRSNSSDGLKFCWWQRRVVAFVVVVALAAQFSFEW